MGLTKKLRNKKADQETQSPVIKVFKDMMHRSENAHNPEKMNLIKSKHEKKTKRYTRSKAKSDEKSDDTSAACAERNYSVLQNQQPQLPQSFTKVRSTTFPAAPAPAPAPTENNPKMQTGSKTSSKTKCMWQSSEPSKMSASKDDTCSCMTCALRRLNKAQRNRLLTIGALLLITLIVAMYCILRPSPPKKCRDLTKTYEILARTLQPDPGDKRDRRSQYRLGAKGTVETQDWDDSKSKLLSGLSDLYGSDFADGSLHEGNLHEANPPESSASSSLSDLSNVLDPNKISEGYSSNSLRNFYKKLIQTDIQIKNLKKSIRDIKPYDYTDLNLPRSKRSLKTVAKVTAKDAGRVERHNFKDLNVFFPPACAIKMPQPKVNKVKREFNYSDPSGIVIEQHKLVLEYEPKTKVAKCSHTPKDAKTKVHESEHKNPFVQHSERLDDLLDRLLSNPKVLQVPGSILDKLKNAKTGTLEATSFPPLAKSQSKCCCSTTDLALLVKKIKYPHGSNYVLSTENIFEIKHHKVKEYDPRHRSDDNVDTASEVDQMQEHLQKVKQQFNGVLSVSTLINGNKIPEEKKAEAQRKPSHRRQEQVDPDVPEELTVKAELQQMPGHRRLLQVDPGSRPPEELEEKAEVQRMPGYRRLLQVDLDERPKEKTKAQRLFDQRQPQYLKGSEEKVSVQQMPGHRRLLQLDSGLLSSLPEEKPKDKAEVQQMPGDLRLLQEDSGLHPGLLEEVEEKREVWRVPGQMGVLQVDLVKEPKDKAEAPWIAGHRRLLQHLEESGEKAEFHRMPGHRRLLQVDLEEDRWEVDPAYDEVKRTRRMGQLQPPKQTKKNYLIDTHNPNWKDTMPLYPDELNAIIKQAAIQNYNKAMPMNGDSTVTKDMSDTEYVEDYANSKYDKLVKMAQAYSDYGVLDDKKEMRNDKTGKGLENRVKLSAQAGLGFFGRMKKQRKHYEIPEEVPVLIEKEGIRFEFKPNPEGSHANGTTTKHLSAPSEHNTETFQFGKHVKIAENSHQNQFIQPPSPTRTPILKSFDFMTPTLKAIGSPKPIKQTRFNDRGLFFFGSHGRSLKSVDVEDEEYDDESTETYNINGTRSLPNTTSETVMPYGDDEFETDSEYSTVTSSYSSSSSDNKVETNVNNMTMDDVAFEGLPRNSSSFEEFYEEITDWIMSMSGSDSKANLTNDTGRVLDDEKVMKPHTILMMPLPPFPIFSPAGIRYNKRKLMSVEENQNNGTSESVEKEVEKRTEESLTTDTPAQATTVILKQNDNASNVEENTAANDAPKVDNKTIVKRSAPDTNLIFWNDIYDEEYGVKDPLDDSVRDKHAAIHSEILSKPRSWIGVKLRKIADKVRKTARNRHDEAITLPVTIRNKIKKRSDKLFEDPSPSDKLNFVALTANMKKVCKEAAKAVRETKSSEGSKSEAASTLMQQLVGLMSDLVEIQVQQKTCVQLPPDLQKFLVWLTSPNPEDHESNQYPAPPNEETTSETYPPGGLPTEIFHEIPTSSPDLLPSSTDVRTECLGTIHDVQRLITLYDGMSEEDKSKMSGVREYLENQLDFLHKQLSNFEGFYDPTVFHQIRRRRTPKHKRLRRMKRKIHRFIKNFGKKRTRSTVTYDAFETYTDSYNSKTDGSDTNAIKGDKDKDETKDEKGNDVKRNLPDVYYRALAESRNLSTIKSSSTKSTQ